MGSDPRRLDGLRADERTAAHLLEQVTGGEVRAHDVGTRQGAYDLHLTLPGGRTAAVEVTTHSAAPRRDDALLTRRRSASGGRPPAAGPILVPADFAGAVSDLLTVPHVARRAAKVAAARGVEERHLFIGVGVGGMPDAVRLALAAPPATRPPQRDPVLEPPVLEPSALEHPEVPESLDRLWLTAGQPGVPLLSWSPGDGWRVHPT